MKQILRSVSLILVSFAVVAGLVLLALHVPSVAHAANPLQDGLNKVQDQFPQTTGVSRSATVVDIILYAIRILLYVAMAIDVFFIIIGGYQYITSAGNEERAGKGRKTLVNAIIGLIIIIMSYTIVSVVNNQFAK